MSGEGKSLPLGAVVLPYLVRRQSQRLGKPFDVRAEVHHQVRKAHEREVGSKRVHDS